MSVLQRPRRTAIVILPAVIGMKNAQSVYAQLCVACAPRVMVVADLTSTRSCNSTGIQNITLAHQHAKTVDGQIRLALPAGVVHRVLELLGLDKVLLIYPTVEDAVNGDG